ncbi:hypothetical protein RP20_CCG001185 [Aedes albopictus]|nr:hypothetical protein RP20_CCG001185 [Aedes albopictus]
MNRKIALILLGAVCLFALVNQSSATKGDKQSDVQQSDPKEEGRGGHGRGFDFRKEVETIFDKYGVDTKVRDNILNDIKQRMEALHKEKGGFRKKRRHPKEETPEQGDAVKA